MKTNRRNTAIVGFSGSICIALIAIIANAQHLSIPDAIEQLKMGNVADEDQFIIDSLHPYGDQAIEAMIEKLQTPLFFTTNGISTENSDFLVAVQVLQSFGDPAFSNLLDSIESTNAFLRANSLSALSSWDREECFSILTNALHDTNLAYPGNARAVPIRICDGAYGSLWQKIEALGFSPPYQVSLYDSFSETVRDVKISELQGWWHTNGTDVIQEFRDQQ